MRDLLKIVESWGSGCSPAGLLLPAAIVFFALLLTCLLVRSRFAARARTWTAQLASEVARREAAEAANQTKADFLGYMSHQIRIPLNAIIGFTELALETPLNTELRDYLGTVRTSADWLYHVANDVLEFARIEAGTLKLEHADFSLADCVRSTVNIVRAEADARHLALKHRVDDKIPALLRGDAGRLRQILFNLVENAVKYTTSGSVIVTAQALSISPSSVTVQFKVADTGIGMSEGKQKDLFEPLALRPSVDTKWKSSAFGLGISQRLVGMMGGTIEAQSMLGAGTTVHFDASFGIASAPAAAAAPSASTPGTHPVHVNGTANGALNGTRGSVLAASGSHSRQPAAEYPPIPSPSA